MNKDLLAAKLFSLSPTMTLKIRSNNTKCSSLTLQIAEKIEEKQCTYYEIIQSQDFSHGKESSSILFLKLTIQGSLCSGYSNQKWLKYQKVENIIWEKVVVGKDKVDAALQEINKKKSKKYEGVILHLTYPEHILIVLPKVLHLPNYPELNSSNAKKDKCIGRQEEAKRIFFSSTS